jgi:hypothetical protein
MREDQLADAGLLRHLTALSCVEMSRAWSISRKRTIEYGKIGIGAKPDERIAIL